MHHDAYMPPSHHPTCDSVQYETKTSVRADTPDRFQVIPVRGSERHIVCGRSTYGLSLHAIV
jgi:hypothetical protein